MANPVINPAVWADGLGPFTVTNSDFIAADVWLDDIDNSPVELELTIPAGGTVTFIREPASWTAAGTAVLSAGAWAAAPVALGNWTVTVGAGGGATAPATITIDSAASSGGRLRIIVTGIGVQPATIEGKAGTVSIDRVLTAPLLSSVGVTSGLPVRERKAVSMSGAAALGVVQNPAAVPPLAAAPPILSRWTEDPANPLALTDFTSPGATASFTAPGVYQPETLNFTITATLELSGNGTAEPSEPKTTQVLNVAIEPVRYGLVLVVDRSGSMSSTLSGGTISKWDAAVDAAHGWTDLFRAFRPQANHFAGVITFEHGGCDWAPTPANDITFRNPANATATAAMVALSGFGNVNDWNLGTFQSCTPIGDALVEAWQGIGTALGPNDAGAVILLTDGYENSGQVAIGNSAPGGTVKFANRRTQADLSTANTLIGPRVYTIGVGTSVDEDVLNLLGNSYRLITNSLSEVKPAFAAMLGLVVDAQEVMPVAIANDPDAPANALYFPVSTKEQVLTFMVNWSSITDNLRIARRAQGANGAFTLVNATDPGVTVTKRGSHGLWRIDLRLHFPGIPSPATDWRLQHVDSGNTPRALPAANALVMVDLVTKADVSFDKKQYFIGDPIRLNCRIRSGGTRVTGARVIVDCAKPGEGLGTYLAVNAPLFKAVTTAGANSSVVKTVNVGTGTVVNPAVQIAGDPLKGKGLMYKTILAAQDKTDLPIITTPDFELFDDGAHGDGAANDGDYSNVFTTTDKEGTYTFRFRIEGELADGSRFTRTFVKSTWVGVVPDNGLLDVTWTQVGVLNTQVISLATMTPKTGAGEFLGPFRAAEFDLKVYGGKLDGELIDNLDGSYSQRIIHDRDTDPVLSTSIYGVPLAPAGPAFDPPGSPRNCCRLWHRAFRCTINGIKRLLGLG